MGGGETGHWARKRKEKKKKNFPRILHTLSERRTAWLAGIVAGTKEKGSCTRTRGGQSLVRSLNWPTTLCCGGRHEDRGLHASRFLHFLWYFTLTIVSPWTNRSWVLEYLIKGTDSPFPSEFEFSFFSDTRKERIKYLTWARANRENRVCDLERTNVVIS